MKKSIIFVAILLPVNFLWSQLSGQVNSTYVGGGGGNNAVVSHLLGDIQSGNEKRQVDLGDIQGSAYTSDVFLAGKLFYNDSFESNVFYRYNAYMEEIEIKTMDIPGAPVRALQKDKSIQLKTMDGKVIGFKTFIDKRGLTQNGYLTQLASGKYTLYKRSDVKYTQPQKAQNSFVPATPARFTKFTEYYIEMDGRKRIDEIELKKNKLLKLVDETDSENLKLHIKQNNMKVKNEKDLLEILAFLNKS
ncbi:MAG: hypothetical protein AB3N16_15455 [Flavobacteriaceae bacterium]